MAKIEVHHLNNSPRRSRARWASRGGGAASHQYGKASTMALASNASDSSARIDG
jgi:hypothetical protein